MRDHPIDYRKARSAALQQLAGAGDLVARRELERRGDVVVPTLDVTIADDVTLRDLVRQWRTGSSVEERQRNTELAFRAYAELEIRYRVDTRMGNPTHPLLTPGWLVPPPPRCKDWERPKGSTLYPAR